MDDSHKGSEPHFVRGINDGIEGANETDRQIGRFVCLFQEHPDSIKPWRLFFGVEQTGRGGESEPVE